MTGIRAPEEASQMLLKTRSADSSPCPQSRTPDEELLMRLTCSTRSKGRDSWVAERPEIDRIGSLRSCHTCGTKIAGTKTGHFVPDHQPQSSLIRDRDPKILYLHCVSWSNKQGFELFNFITERKK